MNNPKNGGKKNTQRKTTCNSFGDLIHQALKGSQDAQRAYDELRSTYLKEVKYKDKPTKQYWKIFPKSVLLVKEKPQSHPGVRERLHDFYFSINAKATCFTRNLWFAHQFFSKPIEVETFLTTTKTVKRQKMFDERLEELEEVAKIYAGWLRLSGGFSQKLGNFNPTKTDLLADSKLAIAFSETTSSSPTSLGSAAIADLIHEVEQRATYQAGNPKDACEKALYFLSLGRPDIGQKIATKLLAQHPNNAAALYANAVLLLDACRRHQRQAFIHDAMHPEGLQPLEAEEFYHAERHEEESKQAWVKQTQAYLLMLKARHNWPKEFTIKRYELSPSEWEPKIDEWLLKESAARISQDPARFCLPSDKEAKSALKMLKQIISDIWAKEGRWMFNPNSSVFLRRFLKVAACVHVDVAREWLKELETSLVQPKGERSEFFWPGVDLMLPISDEPTLAESLMPAVSDADFCNALFSISQMPETVNLLHQIKQFGLRDELDRRTTRQSLAMRALALKISQSGGWVQALELCREMAESRDWPATETGVKLQACWRYAIVLLLFESSLAAFEENDMPTAAKQAGLALQQATSSLAVIAGEKPLLKFIESDENGDTEIVGDLLRRQSNIVTDNSPTDFFSPLAHWKMINRFCSGPRTCWDEFIKWSESDHPECKSLIHAYCHWLAQQQGLGKTLLPICDAFEFKFDSLKSKNNQSLEESSQP